MIVIFNPVAGRRRAQSLWRVLDILSTSGLKIDVLETRFSGHAVSLARDAAATGARLIVAAGGDGTIAEVANGLTGSDAKLGVIPIGTANVLAHELALPFSPASIAAALAFGRTRPLWPGVLEAEGGERLFVQMVGVGFDGYVVHGLPLTMKRLLGRASYVLQTLRSSRTYPFSPVSLRIDGVETQTTSVIVSKGKFYGGPYKLARDACPGQPGFSVSLFDRGGPGASILTGAALPLGLLPTLSGIRQLRAQEIVFTGNSPIPAQADGEPAGHTPFKISDAGAPISIVVT
jgi:diacylglycerol kinase (ATP)